MCLRLICVIHVGWIVMVATLHSQDDTKPWDQQSYLGLAVRDTDDGLVVSKVFPGPLSEKATSPTTNAQRGDNLVSIESQKVDAAGFSKVLNSMAPGDKVTLVFRRSPEAKQNTAIARGGSGGEEFTVQVELASKDVWSGSIKRGLGDRVIEDAKEGEFESMILARAQKAGLVNADGGVKSLISNLYSVQDANLDPNALTAVVQVFRRPLSIDAVEAQIAERVTRVNAIGASVGENDLEQIAGLIETTLDLPTDKSKLSAAIAQSIDHQTQWNAWDKATALVAHMRNDWSIQNEQAADHVRVIRMSMDQAGPLIGAHLQEMRTQAYVWENKVLSAAMMDRVPLSSDKIPDELSAAVQGDILAFELDGNGHYQVLGGAGVNTYDMSKVAAVVDKGGNDRYVYPEGVKFDPVSPTRNQSIIDLDGNDTFEAMGDFFGPATGVFGYSLIDDRTGDDVYISHGQLSIGAGLFGIGVLIDRGGNDQYENRGTKAGFTMGVGYYGSGVIIDKAGSDTYIGEKLCQGLGGPRGFGAIIDSNGNDLYRANGPTFGSAYGTPAVFLGMSQGFGYGIRSYAAGGVGAIYDLSGNDQYQAGEFSQAGGYFYGLGILHDRGGNDLYYGNRYGQAFAAHQAAGILIDDAGDDTYWSMSAASQAGTWDQSIGMLVDRSGSDTYRCDGLGQGGASMQAFALFLDLAGDDRYSSYPGAVLGQSGSNAYHYQKDHVFSFSLFLDQGEGTDIYAGGDHQPQRTNNTTFTTGSFNKDKPEDSTLYGLFVDGNSTESATKADPEFREWTAGEGEYRVIARFISVANNAVLLEKKNGEEISVPLAKLSQQDRDFVQKQK